MPDVVSVIDHFRSEATCPEDRVSCSDSIAVGDEPALLEAVLDTVLAINSTEKATKGNEISRPRGALP